MIDANFLNLFIEMHTANSDAITSQTRSKKCDEKISGIKSEIQKMKDEKTALEDKIKAHEKEQRDSEKEILGLEDNIKRCNTMMLKLRTSKEVDAKQKEIDHNQEQINELEDKILQAMEDIDQAKLNIKKLDKHVEKRGGVLNTELAEFSERKKKEDGITLKAKDTLEQTQIKLKANEKELKEYWEKEKKFRQNTMVKINQNACGGCYQTLSPQVLQMTGKGIQLVTCPECGRYLYE